MSYQEKKIIVSTLTGVLLLIAYCIYAILKYNSGAADIANDLYFWAGSMLVFIGIGVVVAIVTQIVFHIAIAVGGEIKHHISAEISKEFKKGTQNISSNSKNEDFDFSEIDNEDEMDKLIGLKAMRVAYTIVGIGFITALITLVVKLPPAIMINVIFLALFIASLSEGELSCIITEKVSEMVKLNISNNIRKLRFFADEMTQQELAKRTGVSRQTIMAIESGKYSPSLELAFGIAHAFGVKLDEVFDYTVNGD